MWDTVEVLDVCIPLLQAGLRDLEKNHKKHTSTRYHLWRQASVDQSPQETEGGCDWLIEFSHIIS